MTRSQIGAAFLFSERTFRVARRRRCKGLVVFLVVFILMRFSEFLLLCFTLVEYSSWCEVILTERCCLLSRCSLISLLCKIGWFRLRRTQFLKFAVFRSLLNDTDLLVEILVDIIWHFQLRLECLETKSRDRGGLTKMSYGLRYSINLRSMQTVDSRFTDFPISKSSDLG